MHRRFADLHRRAGWRGGADAFGAAIAVLAGDLCLAWAGQLLGQAGLDAPRRAAAQECFQRMCCEAMAGQYLDMVQQARGPGRVDRALTVARYKTAKYTIERPLHLGGAIAAATPRLLAAYSRFALPLGEAYQLRDDLLGVYGDPAVTGKSTLDDLRDGKSTVLVATAIQRATPAQRTSIDALLGCPGLDEHGAAELRAVLDATGARAAVEEMIAAKTDEALAALHTAPITAAAREALTDLAAIATGRTC
jgi:geranylgeranyl diphosphate synthase type I